MIGEKGNVQMTPAICTQCGAPAKVDPRQEAAICEYCGTPFVIEKAINNYNVQNATVQHVDSINIVKTSAVDSVLHFADKQINRKAEEKKRIEEKARIESEKNDAFLKKYWWVLVAIIGVCFLVIAISGMIESKDSADKIRVNIASSELVGENFEDVVSDLEKAGFTNIETEVIDDLVIGWLTEDGEVEEVEIDGTTSFSSDSKFEAAAKIVVAYHTFPAETSTSSTEDQELVTANSSASATNKAETESEAPSTTTKATNAETTTKATTAATTANVTTAVTTAAPTTATNSATAGQTNAVSMAKSYLDYTAFSHDGLVEQLEYEEFTHEEAVYGADNCGANWNEQAVKQAKSYLDYTAFSHDGLVEQLEYDKFTHEQAVNGADNCGANWNEQAVKQAKAYLDYTTFSRDGLIEQLEYDKFTNEQAVYGVDNCGVAW